jgi:long-chain fatty acid transport protein
MKHMITALGALALTTSLAQAGGIDRSGSNYAALFDSGRVLTLGFSTASPEVAGVFTHPLAGPIPTGNMAQSYSTLSFSYKADLNDKLSYAFFLNSPYGADALYSTGIYTGLEAHWQSTQASALLKYKLSDRASVYGGLRSDTAKAEINIPAQMLGPIGTYHAASSTDMKLGYVVGAAYEIPDIALRVGLTYESAITHKFDTKESFTGLFGGATLDGTAEIKMPQSLALDFQTGVAKDTLVFGQVRWTEWSAWHVRPSIYDAVTHQEVTGFTTDVISYQLGVGRKINDNLSVFARAGYEASDGKVASRLAPTDGRTSFGIGGSWKKDNMKITGGVEYVNLGDAHDASGTQFTGNHALGVGVNVAFSF